MLLIAVLSLFYIASAYFLVKNKKVVFLASLIPALAGHFYLLFLVDEANIKTLSVMSVLSLVSFFMVLISSLFVAFKKDTISYVVFALLASITIWMPAVFNIEFEKSVNYSGHLKSHIAISICAYISLTFAALYAVVLIIKDNHLKNVSSIGEIKLPLDYIERVMLRFSIVGWILLTLSLLTGVVFINNLPEQKILHKLIFSVISWLIVSGFLFKHFKSGFRGRRSAIWLLVGFSFLVLAYFGSSFVLQVILK